MRDTIQDPTCPEHHKKAKYVCAQCGQAVCPDCQATGYDNRVFHRACVEAYRQKTDTVRHTADELWGVKILGWLNIVEGALLLVVVLITTIVQLLSGGFGGARPMLFIGFLIWLLIVAACVGIIYLGVALLNYRLFARTLMLVFAVIGIVSSMVEIGVRIASQSYWLAAGEGVSLLIAALILGYFLRPDVRGRFT